MVLKSFSAAPEQEQEDDERGQGDQRSVFVEILPTLQELYGSVWIILQPGFGEFLVEGQHQEHGIRDK